VRVGPLLYLAAGRLKQIGSWRTLKPTSLPDRSAVAVTSARFGPAAFGPELVLTVNGYIAQVILTLDVGRLVAFGVHRYKLMC